VRLAAAGVIKPLVHATFPLDQAAEAMRALESRTHFGKIVLVP
jgi:NADPH:quinone reductase-like Zn-dependent oxidoreductase